MSLIVPLGSELPPDSAPGAGFTTSTRQTQSELQTPWAACQGEGSLAGGLGPGQGAWTPGFAPHPVPGNAGVGRGNREVATNGGVAGGLGRTLCLPPVSSSQNSPASPPPWGDPPLCPDAWVLSASPPPLPLQDPLPTPCGESPLSSPELFPRRGGDARAGLPPLQASLPSPNPAGQTRELRRKRTDKRTDMGPRALIRILACLLLLVPAGSGGWPPPASQIGLDRDLSLPPTLPWASLGAGHATNAGVGGEGQVEQPPPHTHTLTTLRIRPGLGPSVGSGSFHPHPDNVLPGPHNATRSGVGQKPSGTMPPPSHRIRPPSPHAQDQAQIRLRLRPSAPSQDPASRIRPTSGPLPPRTGPRLGPLALPRVGTHYPQDQTHIGAPRPSQSGLDQHPQPLSGLFLPVPRIRTPSAPPPESGPLPQDQAI